MDVAGAMSNIGQQNVTPGTAAQMITQGYHDGTGAVAGDTDLLAGNIVSGVTIFGVTGTHEGGIGATGNATIDQVLAGVTFSTVAAIDLTGTMPNRGAPSWTPSTVNQSLSAGYYSGGTVQGSANLAAGNIRSGVNIFGVNGTVIQATGNATAAQVLTGRTFSHATGSGTGTMPNRTGNVTAQSRTVSGTTLRFRPQAGYYDGTSGNSVQLSDVNFTAGNIRSGMSIFGITGTYLPAGVPKTGQGHTTSIRTRDDGDLKRGIAWPGPRITDHGNTVTDNLTGLMWTKNGNLPNAERTWNEAIDYCDGMNSGAGTYGYTDWRLPNVRELQSLIDYGRFNPALPSGHPFTGVLSASYWSSSTDPVDTSDAWIVSLGYGFVHCDVKTFSRRVWPVRGGQ